jgi:hypothetical protein
MCCAHPVFTPRLAVTANQPQSVTVNQYAAEPRAQEHYSKSEPGIDLSAWSLVLFTAALAAVAVLQWGTMRRHECALKAMQGAPSTGLAETKKAAEAAKQSADAAERTYLASHRPKLRIRFVVTQILAGGTCIDGDFLAFNTGETAAVLRRCYSEVIVGDSLPPRSDLYMQGGEMLKGRLVQGQSVTIKFPSGGPKQIETDEYMAIRRRQNRPNEIQRRVRIGLGTTFSWLVGSSMPMRI